MNGLQISFFILIALATCQTSAGILESLSRASYSLSFEDSCKDYDSKKVHETFKEHVQCNGLQSFRDSDTSLKEIHKINENILTSPKTENNYFNLLTQENIRQLSCSSTQIQELVNNQKKMDDLVIRLKQIRELNKQIQREAQTLESNIVSKGDPAHCPSSTQEIQVRPWKTDLSGKDEYAEICKSLLKNRAALEMLKEGFPLPGSPAVLEVIDSMTTQSSEVSDQDLKAQLNQAFTGTAADLTTAANQQKDKILKSDSTFTRPEKYSLIKQSHLVNSVNESFPKPNDSVVGLSCNLNASYGKGSDLLNRNIAILSVALTGPLAASSRLVTTGAATVLRGFGASRAAGSISTRAVNALSAVSRRYVQRASLSVELTQLYKTVDEKCLASNDIKIVSTTNTCPADFSAGALDTDDCILSAGLDALGVVFTSTDLMVDLTRIKSATLTTKNQDYVISIPGTAGSWKINGSDTVHMNEHVWSSGHLKNLSPSEYKTKLQTFSDSLGSISEKEELLKSKRINIQNEIKNESNIQKKKDLVASLNKTDEQLVELKVQKKDLFEASKDYLLPNKTSYFTDQSLDEIIQKIPSSQTKTFPVNQQTQLIQAEIGEGQNITRVNIYICVDVKGCLREGQITPQGRVLTIYPVCGPDVVVVNYGKGALEQHYSKRDARGKVQRLQPKDLVGSMPCKK